MCTAEKHLAAQFAHAAVICCLLLVFAFTSVGRAEAADSSAAAELSPGTDDSLSSPLSEVTAAIKYTYQALPATLTGAGSANVSITLTNISGGTLRAVSLLGEEGAVLSAPQDMAPGEELNWKSDIVVSDAQLDAGGLHFSAQYMCPDKYIPGIVREKNVDVFVRMERAAPQPAIEFSRSQSTSCAQSGQSITLTYTIRNTGNVKLTDLTVSDSLFGVVDKLDELDVDDRKTFTQRVTMGSRALSSRPRVSYTYPDSNKVFTRELKASAITVANVNLSMLLWTDARDVHAGDTIFLNCTLSNSGNIGYRKLQLSDLVLGTLGTLDDLKPGKEIVYSRQVIVKANTSFQFTLTATDSADSEITLTSNMLTVDVSTAASSTDLTLHIQPSDALGLRDGEVSFNLILTNNGAADLSNISVSERTRGELKRIEQISAGESIAFAQTYAATAGETFSFTAQVTDANGHSRTVASTPQLIEAQAASAARSTPLISATGRTGEAAPTPAITIAPVQLDISTPIPKAVAEMMSESQRKLALLILLTLALLIFATAIAIFVIVIKRRGKRAECNKARERMLRVEAYRNLNSAARAQGGYPPPPLSTDYFDFDEGEWEDLINSDIWLNKHAPQPSDGDTHPVYVPVAEDTRAVTVQLRGSANKKPEIDIAEAAPQSALHAEVMRAEDVRTVAKTAADSLAAAGYTSRTSRVNIAEADPYAADAHIRNAFESDAPARSIEHAQSEAIAPADRAESELEINPIDAAVIAASGFQSRKYRMRKPVAAELKPTVTDDTQMDWFQQ